MNLWRSKSDQGLPVGEAVTGRDGRNFLGWWNTLCPDCGGGHPCQHEGVYDKNPHGAGQAQHHVGLIGLSYQSVPTSVPVDFAFLIQCLIEMLFTHHEVHR